MRKIASIALCILLLAACAPGREAAQISIIPQPAFLQAEEGEFVLDRNVPVYIDSPDSALLRTAAFLNERLQKAAGFSLKLIQDDPLVHGNEKGIFFLDAGLKTEAYNLDVTPARIVVEYGDGAGAFYAVQTLLQLLPEAVFASGKQAGVRWSLPCCSIEDAPRFPYRGMHLDCCLHFFDIPFLERYIDLMALHKVNRFHWHLTEDQGWRIEIKKYPLLTEKGQWRKETVVGSLYSGEAL